MVLSNLLIQSSPVKDMEDFKLLIKNNNLMDCNKDKRIHQLNKLCDETLERNDIFPISVLDAIFDKKNGNSLKSILYQFNNIYITFQGSAAATRKMLPLELRRKGVIVSYKNMYNEPITEKLIQDNNISDDIIALDTSWATIDNLSLSGDISISADGYWIINGEKTNIEAKGSQGIPGDTPYVRYDVNLNKLQYSYDNINWTTCSDYISAWFKFTGTTGSSQADNIGKIQISRDNGATWSDLSGEFTNSLHIKGYVATASNLPSTAVQGDIYGVGPTYDSSDTEHTNPIYQLYVKDSTGWVNNGRFTSISAGVVQVTGQSTTEVMSQKAVTDEIEDLELEQIQGGVYDVSSHNDGAVFESLSALLSSSDLSTLIPTVVRHGGMSIRFIQGSVPNSDNKYVQYRYMGTDVTGNPNPFLDIVNWQGVDKELVAGSHNLAESGGVLNSIISTDIGMSLRGGNTGEGGQTSYFPFNVLPAGDYYIVINSANDLQNIFIGLATGGENQYITQRLIDNKPITAGNHYFKVTLTGSEIRIKISTEYNQNVAPAGITWSINDTKIDSLNIAETSGSDKSKSVIALHENIGSESNPEYKTISSVNIGAASKVKAGVMTADDRINTLNAKEYTIDCDIAISSGLQYITEDIETLVGDSVLAFELEILDKTFVANTTDCYGVYSNDSYYNFLVRSNKIFCFRNPATTGFKIYVSPNVVTTAGHLKARLRIYTTFENVGSLIFSFTLNDISNLDNNSVDITPVIKSFRSTYAKFRIRVLENTIGLASGREKTFLLAHVSPLNYNQITLDNDNSANFNSDRGTPNFSISLRQGSVTSTGTIVVAIDLAEEDYEKIANIEDNINSIECSIVDADERIVDIDNYVGNKLFIGGENENQFDLLKATYINIGYNSAESKLVDGNKNFFLIPLQENIDSTKYYVWNRFDGESQTDYFYNIGFFATKVPAAVGADVLRGVNNDGFYRGYLDNFDSSYKYLYLGLWYRSTNDYTTIIKRIYSILRTFCFKEGISRSYFSSYVDYYKDKYVTDNQGTENAGKVLGINEFGKVVPTTNVPQKDIYELGGVPSFQGAGNANKTLIIDEGGNVVPGIVTEQGVVTGAVQYNQVGTLYLGADLLAGSAVVLGTGWSGNLSDGFTHASGNTADLTIQYNTTSGKNYVVGLILGSASEASLFVAIGDSPVVDVYNGTTNVNIGIKSEGGYLKIIPASGYNSTVKVTLKEVVEQAEADSSLTLNPRNVNHGNTTDNITGFWNIAVGAENTFRKNQNGSRNIALGYSALANFISGTRNIGIGTFAMSQLKSGDHNIAIGSDSLWYINKASDNVAIGFGAFWQMPSGANFDAQRNVVIGAKTMNGAQTSSYDNVAIGYRSGTNVRVENPNKNVSIGSNAGYRSKEGNVSIGYNAGNNTFGNNNVAVGREAGASSTAEQNNSIAIGYNAKTTKSNQCVIGNSNVTEFILGGKKIVFNEGGSVTWETIS